MITESIDELKDIDKLVGMQSFTLDRDGTLVKRFLADLEQFAAARNTLNALHRQTESDYALWTDKLVPATYEQRPHVLSILAQLARHRVSLNTALGRMNEAEELILRYATELTGVTFPVVR